MNMLPQRYSHLTKVQKGTFGEALAKMAFTLEGFEVYTPEWDDHGVDFVIRRPGGTLYNVQVKTTDPATNPFIYESRFQLSDDFLLVAVRVVDGQAPDLYVARGSEWKTPGRCLNHNSKGGTAGPYFELRLSPRYTNELARFRFDVYVKALL